MTTPVDFAAAQVAAAQVAAAQVAAAQVAAAQVAAAQVAAAQVAAAQVAVAQVAVAQVAVAGNSFLKRMPHNKSARRVSRKFAFEKYCTCVTMFDLVFDGFHVIPQLLSLKCSACCSAMQELFQTPNLAGASLCVFSEKVS